MTIGGQWRNCQCGWCHSRSCDVVVFDVSGVKVSVDEGADAGVATTSFRI